jgi:hypothetical protein
MNEQIRALVTRTLIRAKKPKERPYYFQRISFMAPPGLLDKNGTNNKFEQVRALVTRTLVRAKIPRKAFLFPALKLYGSPWLAG